MAEGLSAAEVGKEIGEHKKHSAHDEAQDRRERMLSVTEALLLSLVAVLAAYGGRYSRRVPVMSALRGVRAMLPRDVR